MVLEFWEEGDTKTRDPRVIIRESTMKRKEGGQNIPPRAS